MKTLNFLPTLTLLVFLFCSNGMLQAQNHRTCGTDAEHAERMKDPEYRAYMKQIRLEIDRLKSTSRSIDCSEGTFTFPVAIHYNWDNIGTTVDQCMIDAAISSIDALNLDFLGLNTDLSDYDALTTACATTYPLSAKSTGSCIDFCIAQYDHPACSGLCDGELAITAGQFSYPNTGGCYSDYINIFVQSGTGQLGVAPLGGVRVLGGNGPQVDASTWGGPGELCTPNELGTTFNSNTDYNLGRTLTHEMGHYFGLEHTFAGACTTMGDPEDGTDDDDGFSDTPFQSDQNFGTPVVINCNVSDAGNTANNSCSTLDMWCSYMDYSNDTHLFMFTTEQSQHMYVNAQLSPISDSSIKCTGGVAAPTADFTTGDDLPIFCTTDNAPYQITMTDNSTRCPSAWNWTFSGAGVTPAASSDENPIVTVSETGEMTVTLISTNATGASTMVTKTVYVSIAEDGSCPDCGPTFTDSGGPNNNYSNGENNTWTYCADAGEVLSLDFSDLSLFSDTEFFNTSDVLWIKFGDTPPTGLSDSDLAGTGTSIIQLDPLGNVSSVVTTPGECISFLFVSTANDNSSGWNVPITCIAPLTCDDGMQNQGEEFVDCGGVNCPTCPSACGFTFTDTGGSSNNYSSGDNGTQWVLCADETDQILNLDFSTFQTEGAALRIYNGDINIDGSNFDDWAFNSQQNGYFIANDGGFSTENPISSSGQCLTFYFGVFNSSNPTTAGFETLVSCCDQADLEGCAYANVNQMSFSEPVSNLCSTNTLADIANFKSDGEISSRSCATLADNQTFYQVTCDGDGGMLTIDVSENSNGGNVDAAIYGPVTGMCPNFTGGSQVACESDIDPASMSIAANANEVYLVVIASENRGEFTVDGSGTALGSSLPITLNSFEATAKGSSAQLNWETAQEINNDYFTILRSNDGINYDFVADIKGGGDNLSNQRYDFIDKEAEDGLNSYRLMQTDLDGTQTLAGTASVTLRADSKKFGIYPNPSSSSTLNLKGLTSSQVNTVRIINSVGTVISLNVEADENGDSSIDVVTLTSGVYFISLVDGSNTQVSKFVKLK